MPLVIAHRGASADAPENTMPAFELAFQQGADMLELDVQCSADGVLVVFHDETTARWEAQARPIGACSLAELRQIPIGSARIATLAEVATLVRERGAAVNIELKMPGLEAMVAALVHAERITDQVLISSFDAHMLREMARVAPQLARAYLMGHRTLRPDVRLRESWPFAALRAVGATAWHPAYQIPLLARVASRVQRAGYRINVWTVNEPTRMQQLIALGVDGIITDHPARLRALLATAHARVV